VLTVGQVLVLSKLMTLGVVFMCKAIALNLFLDSFFPDVAIFSMIHRCSEALFVLSLIWLFYSILSTGQVLRMFVHMVGAKRILLIGRLKGYSILAMKEALPDDGKITSCAVEPYLGVKSQEASDYSSHYFLTSFIFLQELVAVGEHFDIIFIDAAQRSAVNYYNFVMDNHLLRMDGVICVENTLMKGQVYLENISDENVLAVRNLNNVINSDPREKPPSLTPHTSLPFKVKNSLSTFQTELAGG
uniref:Catechol O-methyltransferase n=1 Tax=Chelonoidis abingdonii TaxID=106734 RepID=A0A8C0IK18_CHEAB